jgi:hypothetical protein
MAKRRHRKSHHVNDSATKLAPLHSHENPTSVAPPGWPHIEIDTDIEPEAELHVLARLLKADVGRIAVNETVPSRFGEVRTAMVVRLPGSPPVPVFIMFGPFRRPTLETVMPLVTVRTNDAFRRSPVAMYSRHPIPPYMAYHLSGSPAALLESQAVALRLDGVPFEALADRVPPLARELMGVELDFGPASLSVLDHMLRSFHWEAGVEPLEPTVLLLGAYAGEVIRRAIGGEWQGPTEMWRYPSVRAGSVSVNPVAKVHKQITRGSGDELAPLLEQLSRDVNEVH